MEVEEICQHVYNLCILDMLEMKLVRGLFQYTSISRHYRPNKVYWYVVLRVLSKVYRSLRNHFEVSMIPTIEINFDLVMK